MIGVIDYAKQKDHGSSHGIQIIPCAIMVVVATSTQVQSNKEEDSERGNI